MIFNSTDILKEWAQCVWYWATTKSILWNNNISIFSLLWVRAFETPYLGGVYATSSEELTHWKRPWCWEGLGAGGKGDDRGWDGWMASPTRWTWVWVNSRSWWWTGRPGVLQFMGLQRVGHGWTTKLNWTELNMCHTLCSGYLEQAVSKPLLLLCVEVLSSTFLTLLTIFLLCPSPILVWFRSDWQSCYPIAIGMSRSLTLTCLQPHYSIRPASASSTEMSMRSSPGRSEFFPGNL